MPGIDDRDTVVDHGPAGDAGGDRWSPGGPPPEPGWYEDPWNPKSIRRWDGSQWTGETLSKDATPPPAAPPLPVAVDPPVVAPAPPPVQPTKFSNDPFAPAPQPEATYAATGRRLPNPFLLAGIAAAVVLVGVVVVMSGKSSTSGTATTLPPAPVPTVAKTVGLAGSALTAADLGTGWTASPPAHALTAPEYRAGPCGSAFWSHNVGGYESSLVNGRSAATAHGAAVTMVYKAPSVVEIDQQQTFVSSPAYAACLKQTITDEVRRQLPAGSGQTVSSVLVTPFTLILGIPSKAYVISVTVAGPGAATRQVTVNTVAMFSGHYEATLDVSWSSDAPLGGAIVQRQAANEATHLTSLG
jgi:hypothetical protein